MARTMSGRGRNRTGGFRTPKAVAGHPSIKAWNGANVHAAMPDLSSSERTSSGVSSIRGNLTSRYPKIRGFNGGPSSQLQQPLVNQTGYY